MPAGLRIGRFAAANGSELLCGCAAAARNNGPRISYHIYNYFIYNDWNNRINTSAVLPAFYELIEGFVRLMNGSRFCEKLVRKL